MRRLSWIGLAVLAAILLGRTGTNAPVPAPAVEATTPSRHGWQAEGKALVRPLFVIAGFASVGLILWQTFTVYFNEHDVPEVHAAAVQLYGQARFILPIALSIAVNSETEDYDISGSARPGMPGSIVLLKLSTDRTHDFPITAEIGVVPPTRDHADQAKLDPGTLDDLAGIGYRWLAQSDGSGNFHAVFSYGIPSAIDYTHYQVFIATASHSGQQDSEDVSPVQSLDVKLPGGNIGLTAIPAGAEVRSDDYGGWLSEGLHLSQPDGAVSVGWLDQDAQLRREFLLFIVAMVIGSLLAILMEQSLKAAPPLFRATMQTLRNSRPKLGHRQSVVGRHGSWHNHR